MLPPVSLGSTTNATQCHFGLNLARRDKTTEIGGVSYGKGFIGRELYIFVSKVHAK
jgi:hypothetical protein